jgi:hypothetical protein
VRRIVVPILRSVLSVGAAPRQTTLTFDDAITLMRVVMSLEVSGFTTMGGYGNLADLQTDTRLEKPEFLAEIQRTDSTVGTVFDYTLRILRRMIAKTIR